MTTGDAIIRADAGNYFGSVARRVTVRGLHLSETLYAAQTHIPDHRHDGPSFFMPLRGNFHEGCHGVVREYRPGDVSFHPPYEAHWLKTTPGAKGFALDIGTGWINETGGDVTWEMVPRNISYAHAAWTIVKLHRELFRHDSAQSLVIESLGMTLGIELAGIAHRLTLQHPRWFLRVRDMLQDHAALSPPSLRELAAEAGVTPVAVIKAFHRYEGCTPGAYLRAVRLARARHALAHRNIPISSIALDAGFYDHSHFTRVFRAQSGMAPGEYRAMHRG